MEDLDEESIRKKIDEMYPMPKPGELGYAGLLPPEVVEYKRKILGNFVIDGLGDKIYQLPGGGLTGQGGWEMFQQALKNQIDKWKT